MSYPLEIHWAGRGSVYLQCRFQSFEDQNVGGRCVVVFPSSDLPVAAGCSVCDVDGRKRAFCVSSRYVLHRLTLV